MTTIACVLKLGGAIYDRGHAIRLERQVRRHSPPGTRFVCLTDDESLRVDFARPLKHNWPGMWSKVEAWALPGPCLYLDLDVSILGDLSPLLEAAAEHDLVTCNNFGAAQTGRINNSIVGWRRDAPRHLYDLFVTDPERFMREGSVAERWIDQGFMAHHHDGQIELFQDLLPGMILSYKKDVLKGADASDCRVCVFYGQPKPWHESVPPTYMGE